MQDSVKVSVIIPTYNDGEYLPETIASLKEQTFEDFEVIVIDDASTDPKSLDILDKLQAEGYTVIRLQKNSGPSVARNRGIEIAKGAYILPLDADDKIAPTYLEKAAKILDTQEQVGIVYCKAELFGAKSGEWELPPFRFPDILVGNMIFATAMYRKSDWEKTGGYRENMRHGNEDYDFWLSLIELGREVYRIPETLFYYRIKENSRTIRLQSDSDKEIDTYLQIFHNHKKLYLDNIGIIFETLYRRHRTIIEKTEEIKIAHVQLQQKDREIKKLHRDMEKLTMQLSNMHHQLDIVGKELTYAREVIAYKDRLLDTMRIKNRIKRLLQKLNPFSKNETILPEPPRKPAEEKPDASSVYRYLEPELTDEIKKEMAAFEKRPLLSIIMPVYNVDPKWLSKAIASIEAQWYDNWELCIADDKSTNEATLAYLDTLSHPKIKITRLKENLNISGASNAAIASAEGDYIVLMDNDDEITPDALYELVKCINETDADFIYSDEDFISPEGEYINPHFKPDFSPDLLLSHNYITHISCFKRTLLDEVGHFDSAYDGAQDYELFLRLTEKAARICHIPKVLYHWRMLETSTSLNSEAKPEALERGKRLLEETLRRRGIDGKVEHANLHHYFRVRYTIKDNPLVSIVIPFKDKPELLEMCVNSILEKSTYDNYEIIGISNNSEEDATFACMKRLEAKDPRVAFYEYNLPFNYAQINNHAVETYAKGEHVVLLNNDIEVISPEWIEAMLEHSQRKEIGCVGAKLYYPDDTVQHAGIIIGLGGYAGHSHKHAPRESTGYFNRLNVIQNVSAVTAACLMIEKRIYEEVGGMDEVNFKVAYNDVDFCLRVMEAGYYNLFTPYAEMYHHESVSRGYETTPEKIARFQKEKDALFRRHTRILTEGDPYYNPNLTHDSEEFVPCPRN